MNIFSLQTPFMGYLIAKGIQITVEKLFPPLRLHELINMGQNRLYTPSERELPSRYTTSGLWRQKRKEIRYLYGKNIIPNNSDTFYNMYYSLIWSTFPISTFLLLYFKNQPSSSKEPLIGKIWFHIMVIGSVYHLQLALYDIIEVLSIPFPEVIQRIIKRVAKIFEPAQVVSFVPGFKEGLIDMDGKLFYPYTLPTSLDDPSLSYPPIPQTLEEKLPDYICPITQVSVARALFIIDQNGFPYLFERRALMEYIFNQKREGQPLLNPQTNVPFTENHLYESWAWHEHMSDVVIQLQEQQLQLTEERLQAQDQQSQAQEQQFQAQDQQLQLQEQKLQLQEQEFRRLRSIQMQPEPEE